MAGGLGVDLVGGYAGVVAVVALSFVVAQCLVLLSQRLRFRRVMQKSAELTQKSAAEPDAKRIPITLVTGFLGAGKTTLLNHVLSSADHGLRVAVLINEFGAVSVDHRLIAGHATSGALADVVVMKNGCMCCSGDSPGSELEGILNKLLEMTAVDSSLYDYMLIETSGLADPTAVVHLLFRHEMARSRFVLDGVVTLVDASNVHRHLAVPERGPLVRPRPEVARQLALADVVLLTKTDAIGDAPGGREAVERAVREACPAATIVVSHPARAPLEQLLGIDAFRRRRVHLAPERGPTAVHTLGAQTVCLRVRGALTLSALQAWLQRVVVTHEAELYRLKGTLSIAGERRRFVVQGVHGEVRGHFDEAVGADVAASAQDATSRQPEDDESSVLVLIASTGPPPDFAHQLDEAELQSSLQACALDGEGSVVVVRTDKPGATRRAAPALDGDECVDCGDEQPLKKLAHTEARARIARRGGAAPSGLA
ncbi:hypothetical protein KFE25_007036 [Diacronema lutheri]|uniref:CobW C-terminal domain-containing protein n=3 Tax=Diacronema lutheri TaxID=2081491 RepID=A0A8J5XPY3_DIALT|nr:hypothetical protein KFE25_007036 [Diacronema lutheri]